MKMEFKPEDFPLLEECGDLVYAAQRANAKLKEWLDAAPKVYANRYAAPMRGNGELHADWHECDWNECRHTHTARLVCIEKYSEKQ